MALGLAGSGLAALGWLAGLAGWAEKTPLLRLLGGVFWGSGRLWEALEGGSLRSGGWEVWKSPNPSQMDRAGTGRTSQRNP